MELLISHMGGRGDGVAETDAGPVFVAFTLPGERVGADVDGKRAALLEIIEPSKQRVQPLCPHFTVCGGCAVQHWHDDAYGAWKRGIVEAALKHQGISAPVGNLIDAHGSGRRRVTLHVQSIKGQVMAGFMQARSHRLLDLDRCPILVPALENATQIARRLAAPWGRRRKPFDIRITATATGLDCNIQILDDVGLDTRLELADCANDLDLARVTVAGDSVLERRPPTIHCGLAKVTLPPGGFLQATHAGEEILTALVVKHAGAARRIADLFCGIGPFALRLAQNAAITAADNDAAAIAAIDEAARHTNGLKPLRAEVRDLFQNPYSAGELASYDAVIFDPPRSGARKQAFEIAASAVPTVIAVSCAPQTFARDAVVLIDGGYRLQRVTPVDQFKYSSHVELVALFTKT